MARGKCPIQRRHRTLRRIVVQLTVGQAIARPKLGRRSIARKHRPIQPRHRTKVHGPIPAYARHVGHLAQPIAAVVQHKVRHTAAQLVGHRRPALGHAVGVRIPDVVHQPVFVRIVAVADGRRQFADAVGAVRGLRIDGDEGDRFAGHGFDVGVVVRIVVWVVDEDLRADSGDVVRRF